MPTTNEGIIALKELLNEARCQVIKCRRVADQAAALTQAAEVEHSKAVDTVKDLEDKLKKRTNAHFLERVFSNFWKGN